MRCAAALPHAQVVTKTFTADRVCRKVAQIATLFSTPEQFGAGIGEPVQVDGLVTDMVKAAPAASYTRQSRLLFHGLGDGCKCMKFFRARQAGIKRGGNTFRQHGRSGSRRTCSAGG